ncbi:hypothetical protein [Bailinhaonella thermotolerans]|uniref:Mur ligase central domain-containing protein n=1 Tax=Bailinhaonella thermotolerans TaxID=1070861 RepID=A0A3A4B7K8_9ACTN|nr:hypothetical protein [Bailinhaonella thermotolerans]RJL34557.1 hypothetical protein D5H75_09135 [Bailinhaonella thermotolerans]
MDEVFFREWEARAPGWRRDLGRARALTRLLDLPDVPVLTVVGSKGKGTAAAHATAALVAAGLTVVTVTSPGLRSDRERIRVNGTAIAGLAGLGETLAAAIARLGPPRDGYLSPSGLFTVAGMLHAREVGADAVVLEAGMGGASDEVSLFPATVVGVTEIFAEHLGVLGDTVPEIAREKIGVVAPSTRAVVSLPQSPHVRAAFAAAGTPPAGSSGPGTAGAGPSVTYTACAGTFSERNSCLGRAAGLRLLAELGLPEPGPLPEVRLPGRMSVHPLGGDAEVVADCAITRAGVAAALEAAGDVDHVLLCLPDHKDVAGAVAELDGRVPVTFVRLPYPHLRFTHPLPESWPVVDAAALTAAGVRGLGRRVLALGTVYFIGRVLDLAGADTDHLFPPPSAGGS